MEIKPSVVPVPEKTIIELLESSLTKDEITRKVFDKSDKDKSGKIDIAEIHEIIKV